MVNPNLPVNIDTTYADNAGDASQKTHQQHHDTIHTYVNALDSNYAGISTARPGNLFAFLGDSTTLGNDDPTNLARGESWPVYGSIMSGQVIRYVRNAGLAGNTTAQQLARFDTDVTPYNPTCVVLLCGTTDQGVVEMPAWQTSVIAIIAKIRAISAVPVLCTMFPNSSGGGNVDRAQQIIMWNQWLRSYSARNGILLLDFYNVITDPITGTMKAAYVGDGVHPSAAGYAAMGSYMSSTLLPRMTPNTPTLCQTDVDDNNSIYQGTFASMTGTANPTGWTEGIGVPAGSAVSYTTDSAVDGKLLTITHTAVAANVRNIGFAVQIGSSTTSASSIAGAATFTMAVNPTNFATLFVGTGSTAEIVKVSSVSGAGPYTVTPTHAMRFAHASGETVVINGTVGDNMVFTGVITSNGGVAVQASIATYARGMLALTQAMTRGTFLAEGVIPASTTTLFVSIQAGTGTGVASFGQVGFYNATRLGWAT